MISAGSLRPATAALKLVGGAGGTSILQHPDPILGIPFRYALWVDVIIGRLVMSALLFSTLSSRSDAVDGYEATGYLTYSSFNISGQPISPWRLDANRELIRPKKSWLKLLSTSWLGRGRKK